MNKKQPLCQGVVLNYLILTSGAELAEESRVVLVIE